MKPKKPQQRKHWYHTTTWECVLCGHSDVYRERIYDKKPKSWTKRFRYIEKACTSHFL